MLSEVGGIIELQVASCFRFFEKILAHDMPHLEIFCESGMMKEATMKWRFSQKRV